MAVNSARLAPGLALVVVAALLVALGGCRRSAPPEATVPPAVTPAPQNGTGATNPPRTLTPAPTVPAATLPNTLLREWQPMSNVLLAFGPMTIAAGQVQWGSGQTSPYTLISTEGGFVLRLEATPSFYDSPNPYIKLIPKTDASGAASSMEVAFYGDEAQLKADDYVMYGSYFAN